MNKFLLALIVGFSLIGCSISEQIIFNQEGSGKLSYTIDMSKMITMTKDLDKSDKMVKEWNEKTEKDMDSIIAFKDIAAQYGNDGKEMTAEQLANMEQMKNYTMRIVVNKAKSEMKYILSTDFKTISEVGNVGSAFSAIKDFSGKKTNALDAANPTGNTEVKFSFDGKSFARTVAQKPYVEEVVEEMDSIQLDDEMELVEMTDSTVVDSAFVGDSYYEDEVIDSSATVEIITDEDVANSELEKEEEVDMKKVNKEFKKMGKMMKKGLEDSAFEFQYTFAKKIKKVSLPKSSYKLSADKKTIFIKYKFEEFTKKIKDLNLNIEFE
jgi:hypothetical protein